jgi:outer membrane immunogenic protein
MKKSVVAGITTALIVLAGAAEAADLRAKAPAMAPVASWTGFYGGVSVGARWADPTWSTTAIPLVAPFGVDPTTTPASFDSTSVRVGGYFGYNWQLSPLWVVGIEGDIAWANSSKSLGGIPGTFGTAGTAAPASAALNDSSRVEVGSDGSIRGRLGYLVTPAWLVYATGGIAWQGVEVSATCNGALTSWCVAARSETSSSTQTGWTIGGGLEGMFSGKWLARAEYRYADYGSFNHIFFAGTVDQVTTNQSLKTHTVLFGLAYKF